MELLGANGLWRVDGRAERIDRAIALFKRSGRAPNSLNAGFLELGLIPSLRYLGELGEEELAIKLIDAFRFDGDRERAGILTAALVPMLERANTNHVFRLMDAVEVPTPVLRSERVVAGFETGIEMSLRRGCVKSFVEFVRLINIYGLEEVRAYLGDYEDLHKAKLACVEAAFLERAIDFDKRDFVEMGLVPEEYIPIVERAVIRSLASGNPSVTDWAPAFGLSGLFFKSPPVLDAARAGLREALANGYEDVGSAFLERMPALAAELRQELVDLFDALRPMVPQMVSRAERSGKLLLALYAARHRSAELVASVARHPFLVRAVNDNQAYGSSLLVKFSEFDEEAQKKIAKIFELYWQYTGNPASSAEGVKRRREVQRGLLAFERNREIVERIEQEGIRVKAWLDYEVAEEFGLDAGGRRESFGELAGRPFLRTKQYVDGYCVSVREELGKNKGALVGARIRGVSLWDHLTAEIAKLKHAGDAAAACFQEIQKSEAMIAARIGSDGERLAGKALSRVKSGLARQREEFKNRWNVLERGLENYSLGLEAKLLQAFDLETARAINRAVHSRLAEALDHFGSDKKELATIFGGQVSKDQEKLADREMRLALWGRDPNRDLYLGNYTSCCVSIEGPMHGEKCPIADYITDLGVQVVTIEDKAEERPVVAAWLWLGKSSNGETALVVDNIEADTAYSLNFSTQLSEKLFGYLIEYAKCIGVNRLVLGTENNDLPAEEWQMRLGAAEGVYIKIGGTNGRGEYSPRIDAFGNEVEDDDDDEEERDDGYYLEAEGDTVLQIWP